MEKTKTLLSPITRFDPTTKVTQANALLTEINFGSELDNGWDDLPCMIFLNDTVNVFKNSFRVLRKAGSCKGKEGRITPTHPSVERLKLHVHHRNPLTQHWVFPEISTWHPRCTENNDVHDVAGYLYCHSCLQAFL